jgi:pyruvate/2-oxoglutarate dehydrogenase complex dihydrolipoamide acyltransferase (E2) component
VLRMASQGVQRGPADDRIPSGVAPLELTPAKIAEIHTLRRVREEVVPSTVAIELSAERLDTRLRREATNHGAVSALELALYETARLLPEWPELNGYFANGRAWRYETVAVGFAVNLGRSLRVPIVRDASERSLRDVARTVRDLSLRYMRNELTIDDVTGGTFTITDLSSEGVVHFVPVLNERQAAILGICASRSNGSRELVLTFDHRLSDGMQAGRFLAALRARLEQANE